METCTYGSEGDAWEPTIAIWKGTGYLPYQASGQSGSTNGGSSSVGKASAPLHEEIQTSGYGGSTSEGSFSVGSMSTPVHEEIQTSGYGGSTSESSSSVGSMSTPVHEEIQTSGYGGSTSESSSSVESVSYPTPTREPSASMPTGNGSSTSGGYTGTSPSKTTN
jgi:hypothetical protein